MSLPIAQLTTARLTLRPLESADWPAIHAFTGDAEVQRYISGAPLSERETRDLIEMLRDWAGEQPPRARPFAFVHTASKQIIGFGGLYWGGDHKRWQAELGYTLHRAWWGQGYATEAGAAMLRFGFTELHLHRIFAECHPANTGSARVMLRLGMRYEGCMREVEWYGNGWWDMLHHAILDHEWRDQEYARAQGMPTP
jgi:RimJ/RimL family protein N-acetyltransferase